MTVSNVFPSNTEHNSLLEKQVFIVCQMSVLFYITYA